MMLRRLMMASALPVTANDPYIDNVTSHHHFDEPVGTIHPQDCVALGWENQRNDPIELWGPGYEGVGYKGILESEVLPSVDLLLGDFTVDLVFMITGAGTKRLFSTGGGAVAWGGTSGIHILVQRNSNSGLTIQVGSGTASPISSSSVGNVLLSDVKYEVRITKSSGTIRGYIDGQKVVEFNASGAVRPISAPRARVGSIPGEDPISSVAFSGWWDEFRITKGVARSVGESYTPKLAPFFDFLQDVPKAHRYWRIWISRTYATVGTASGYVNVTDTDLRTELGGSNRCSEYIGIGSGGQSSVLAPWTAENCFESGILFHSNNENLPIWMLYEFGVGNELLVREITWAPANINNRQFRDFIVQGSDDGAVWRTRKKVHNTPSVANGVLKTASW